MLLDLGQDLASGSDDLRRHLVRGVGDERGRADGGGGGVGGGVGVGRRVGRAYSLVTSITEAI